MTAEDSVRALFDEVAELDHLFVSAAPGCPGAFLEQDLAAARTFMDGKFFGSWLCARYAPPGMRAGGSITFVTGGAVVRPPRQRRHDHRRVRRRGQRRREASELPELRGTQ